MCLELPETVERETWGVVTFRVNNKLFAVYGENKDVPHALIFKPNPAEFRSLSEDQRIFSPSHFVNWCALNLEKVDDWQEVAELVTDSYLLIAPKRLHEGLAP